MRSFGFTLVLSLLLTFPQLARADAGEEWNQYVAQRETDLSALRKCIDTEKFRITGGACGRMTVPACLERLDESGQPVSRIMQDKCWADEFSLWKVLYGEVVELVLDGALFQDRDAFNIGSQNSGTMELFLRIEAGWLSNLANQCELQGAHFGAGTARSTTYYACRIDLYAERVSDLGKLGIIRRDE